MTDKIPRKMVRAVEYIPFYTVDYKEEFTQYSKNQIWKIIRENLTDCKAEIDSCIRAIDSGCIPDLALISLWFAEIECLEPAIEQLETLIELYGHKGARPTKNDYKSALAKSLLLRQSRARVTEDQEV